MALAVAALALVTTATVSGCGSGDTTAVGSSTTSAAATGSTRPSSDTFDGLVETLTKMGISEKQARCVVEKMDEASNEIGGPGSLDPDDQTYIEKLLKDCAITD